MSAATFTASAMPTACHGGRAASSAARRVAFVSAVPTVARASPKLSSTRRSRALRMRVVRASEGEAPSAEAAPAAAPVDPVPDSFSKICALEDLPRGDRKKVTALGKSILLFWYKVGNETKLELFFHSLVVLPFFSPSPIGFDY